MEYFVYGRDRMGAEGLRRDVTEAHWSFMDRYADSLIARGPTFDDDAITGSVHIVDLPDSAAAQTFAYDEPYFRAGVFETVSVCRWHNTLARTMWGFDGADGPRHLVVAHAASDGAERWSRLQSDQIDYLHGADVRDGIILCGPLLGDDGADWLGTAWLLEAADRASAHTVVADGPEARAGLYGDIEIHGWRFGGRSAAEA